MTHNRLSCDLHHGRRLPSPGSSHYAHPRRSLERHFATNPDEPVGSPA